MAPFTATEAREIGIRDKWTCKCGRRFQDGWLVDAAHDDAIHFLKFIDPQKYHDTNNGEIKCLTCHIEQHANMGDWKSVQKAAQRAWDSGLHTRRFYESKPEQLREDRIAISELLTNLGAQGKVHLITK